jgi:hypothetical protein
MRRPEMASTHKRNRARLRLKKGPGKQTAGRLRRQISRRLPVAPPEAASTSTAEVAAREPVRCGFGAVRVGALLARLRLHLQTDRFLAVHRGDAVWEAGCLKAALALADIVAGMREGELDASLPPQRLQDRPVPGTPRYEVASHTSECELWGTRKTGTATLARCSAALERSVR